MSVSRLSAFARRTPFLLVILCLVFLYFRSDLIRFDPIEDMMHNQSYDDVSFELPVVRYFHQRLANGDLALWNPYQSAGNPVIGTLQQRLLYPPRLIPALIFGVEWGQFLEIVFHFFLGVLGTYAFLRTYAFRPLAAAAGSVSVLLSVEFLSATYSHNVFASLAWVPICLYSIRIFIIRPVLVNACLLGMSFAMLLYAGYPQFAYYALHLCIAVFLTSTYTRRNRILGSPVRFCLLLGLALLLALAISLPQLLTAAEFFALGIRGVVGVSQEQFHLFSGYSLSEIFTRLYSESKTPFLHAIAPMIFGGFILGWFRLSRLRIHIIMMIVIMIPFILLVMGTSTPFSTWIYNHYPLGSAFRAPMRALYILLFPCAFGIATLAHVLLSSKGLQRYLLYALVPITLTGILLPLNRFRAHAFLHTSPYMNAFVHDLKQAIPAGSNHRFATITGFQTEPYRRTGMMAELRSFSEYEPSNSYRFYAYAALHSDLIRNNPRDAIWLGDAMVGFGTLGDTRSLEFLRAASVDRVIADSMEWSTKPEWLRSKVRNSGTVSETGAIEDSRKLNIAKAQMGNAAFAMMSGYFKKGLPLYQVFSIASPLPRAYTTIRVQRATNLEDSIEKMQPPFNPIQQTVIEGAGPIQPDVLISESDSFKPAEFLLDEPERVVIRTSTLGNAFLILNDKFFPGWQCKVDGKDVTIFAANILFRAVQVPPGVHEVEFVYKDQRFQITFIVSLVVYGIVLIAFILLAVAKLRGQSSTSKS
ncbi:MAG: YfhO family protein [Spirochaetia bacterium]|nr:YfhO family protein [Spirochaetia bacterium]